MSKKTCGLDGDLYVDRNGQRYTTCPVAAEDDPWYGATILSWRHVRRLEDAGLLPLEEVVRPGWADLMKKERPWWQKLWDRITGTTPYRDAYEEAVRRLVLKQ